MVVLWVTTAYRIIHVFQHFGQMCHLHLHTFLLNNRTTDLRSCMVQEPRRTSCATMFQVFTSIFHVCLTDGASLNLCLSLRYRSVTNLGKIAQNDKWQVSDITFCFLKLVIQRDSAQTAKLICYNKASRHIFIWEKALGNNRSFKIKIMLFQHTVF